jgi:hypothetical protein
LCFLFSRLIFWYFNSLYGCGKTFHFGYFFHPKTWIASLFYLSNIVCHSTPLLQHTCEGHPAVGVYALSDPMGICKWYCQII